MTLSVKNLTINTERLSLLNDFSFQVERGTVLTIMGPSGCGKSTLLSAIAGHLAPEFHCSGEVRLNGDNVISLNAEKRHIGILFQEDLLFPHLNIWQNLAFGLSANLRASEKKIRAIATLEELNLGEIANKMPDQISGGQRARISLMRTLLSGPSALLLDEPFSKLDKPLRKAFRAFVFEQIAQRQIAAVMVTHDEDDVPDPRLCIQWPDINASTDSERSRDHA
ncbi:ATP-binding cassette domain-containing protein [Veronia pacifica]|uniref:ABC transporter ATP-binding protein n=1 Tax=Veronia pacifica TaxID=1080227 RepID=A0A1C3EBR9_9GAMM|nr:ATP-binding cassette domain-containing protein [Veronia pacifica]ODA30696.1 ABC transporter ATP-binding protein [Veronia pacifica]